MLIPWDLGPPRHLSRHEESKSGQKSCQKNKHWRIIMFTLRVILKMESNSMLKSRPRYQQPFSSADISFYHVTISSPSCTSSSIGLLRGNIEDWLVLLRKIKFFRHFSLIHEANLFYQTQYIVFKCFAYVKAKRYLRHGWMTNSCWYSFWLERVEVQIQ